MFIAMALMTSLAVTAGVMYAIGRLIMLGVC